MLPSMTAKITSWAIKIIHCFVLCDIQSFVRLLADPAIYSCRCNGLRLGNLLIIIVDFSLHCYCCCCWCFFISLPLLLFCHSVVPFFSISVWITTQMERRKWPTVWFSRHYVDTSECELGQIVANLFSFLHSMNVTRTYRKLMCSRAPVIERPRNANRIYHIDCERWNGRR